MCLDKQAQEKVLKGVSFVITINSANIEVLQDFQSIQPGMKLHCTYMLQNKRDSSQGTKDLTFTGPVIQKTKYLIVVRDIRTKLVHCLSIFDCICKYGKYKVLSK